MSYSNGPKIVTSGMILYLDAANSKSYSGTGTAWNDLSGNNHNGTLTNGPIFSSTFKGGFLFDGINEHVSIPYSSIFNIQNFTLSAWVRFVTFDTFNALLTNPQTGTIDGGWPSPYTSWMLRINSNTTITVAIGTSTTYSGRGFSYTLSTNTIYNIVGTYNGSLAMCYINGSKLGESALSGTINYTSKPVVVGTDYGGSFSNCSIYNTSVYNRALSASEIAQNYNAIKGRFNL